MPRTFVCALLVPLVLLFGGCETNDAPEGNGVSDEAYLAAFCGTLDHYSDALAEADTVPAIEVAMRDYIAVLGGITTPRDLQRFHADFIAYVEAGLAEPGRRIDLAAPRPPGKVADRIAIAETTVDECQDATYFGKK